MRAGFSSRGILHTVVIAFLFSAGASAGTGPADPVAAAADLVQAAGQDRAALGRLAERPEPDPWLVALELAARDDLGAARAFAAAASGLDVRALPRVLAGWAGKSAALRDGIDRTRAAAAEAMGGDPDGAMRLLDRGAMPGDPVLDVLSDEVRALVAERASDFESAREFRKAAAEGSEAVGWLRSAVENWSFELRDSSRARDLPAALAACDRVRELQLLRGDVALAARAVANRGVLLERQRHYPQAVLALEQAMREIGGTDPRALAGELGLHLQYELGGALLLSGQSIRAEAALAEAVASAQKLHSSAWVERCSVKWARALFEVGRTSRAEKILKRGLEDSKGRNHASAVFYLAVIADHRRAWGDSARLYAEAGREMVALGLEADADRAALLAARAVFRGGDPDTAASRAAALLPRLAKRGDDAAQVSADRLLAEVALTRGDTKTAARHIDRARELTLADAPARERILLLVDESRLARAKGDARAGFESACACFELVRDAIRSQSALTAPETEDLLLGPDADAALLALRDSPDPGPLLHVMELRRSQALLGALANAQRLRATPAPEALVRKEREARAGAAAALSGYRKTLGHGNRREIATAWREYAEKRDESESATLRVREAVRATAGAAAPEPVDVATAQSHLGPDDAIVVYEVLADEDAAWAEVIGPKGPPRTVILPPPSALAHMVEGDGTSPAFIAAVADRLGLPPGVHRLFVSPSGILLAADLPSTFPGREVVLIPSMTAWCLLRDRADPPGKSVLALGDPAYPQTDAPAGGTRSASGLGKLPRLPATRLEARAVGSRLLLGEKATETALRAAIAAGPEGKGGRWHAIHLACHGLQDEDEPMRSALVLLADDHNDGLLTAQDVFSMSVPADLVVLSSCSAGGGRIYRGEGLVGLVGAFLAAGSPRVLVNWHEVDDESTRVLMTRFYAEWHGRTTAAEALRRAQAAVRSEKRWRDPRYWAGWRLWGLP